MASRNSLGARSESPARRSARLLSRAAASRRAHGVHPATCASARAAQRDASSPSASASSTWRQWVQTGERDSNEIGTAMAVNGILAFFNDGSKRCADCHYRPFAA